MSVADVLHDQPDVSPSYSVPARPELQLHPVLKFLARYPQPVACLAALPLRQALNDRINIARRYDNGAKEGEKRRSAFRGSRTVSYDSNEGSIAASFSESSKSTIRGVSPGLPSPTSNNRDYALVDLTANEMEMRMYPGIDGASAEMGSEYNLKELYAPVWTNTRFRDYMDETASLLSWFSVADGIALCDYCAAALDNAEVSHTISIQFDDTMLSVSAAVLSLSEEETFMDTDSLLVLTFSQPVPVDLSRLSIGASPTMRTDDTITAAADVDLGLLRQSTSVPPPKKRKRSPTFPLPSLSTHSASRLSINDPFYTLLASSQCGQIILNKDWSSSALGPINSWSPELRSIIQATMSSPFRCACWCGENMNLIYGDAYISTAGKKHPGSLGLEGSLAWAELWDELGPLARKVMSGQVIFQQDSLLFMERNADIAKEETYYSYSWVPIFDKNNQFVAALNPSFETTSNVISERTLSTLRDLSQTTSRAQTIQAYLEASLVSLSRNPYDIPFALLYSCKSEKKQHRQHLELTNAANSIAKVRLSLIGTLGIPEGHSSAPSSLLIRMENSASSMESSTASNSSAHTATTHSTQDESLPWPFYEALSGRKPVYISQVGPRCADFELRGWNEPSRRAVVVPITSGDSGEPQAVLIVGLNPRRPWNEIYAQSLQLIARQLTTGIDSVQLYQETAEKAASLARLDAAKTVFFSNISHELRQPLQLILAPLSDVLENSKSLDAQARGSLDVVMRHSKRLLKLVNSLLDFSALEAGRAVTHFKPVPFSSFTADLASLFRSAVEKSRITFVVDVEQVNTPVWLDIEVWEKIVFNILGNAFKYTLKGRITVRVWYTHTTASFSVADTGVGISEDEIGQIFDRFHRVDSTSRSHEGSGIGLSLVSELLKILGAQIQVQSQLGIGTTFTVTLPLGTSHLPPEKLMARHDANDFVMPNRLPYAMGILDEASSWNLPDKDTPPMSESSHTSLETPPNPDNAFALSTSHNSIVLVADDNQDMRAYLKSILSKYYKCITVSDGQEALDYAQKNPVDLVLSDIMMPRMDGFALLKALHQDSRTHFIPIILVSARAGEQAQTEGILSGAVDYLHKPFQSRELLARVENHLQLGKMRAELEQRVQERTQALVAAEGRSRDLAEQLGTVLRMSPVGIFSATSDGVLSYVNPAWRRITGCEETMDGFLDMIHPDDRRQVQQAWTKVIEERSPITQLEFRWNRHEAPTHSQIDIHPQENHDGTSIIGSLTDTSSIKQLETLHMQAMEQRAIDAERMRRIAELNVDVASHEVRNPLSAMWQNAELVGESLDRMIDVLENASAQRVVNTKELMTELDQDLDAIESIILCAGHLKNLTEDILGWSKLSMGLLTLSKIDFDVRSMATKALKMFEVEASQKNVDLNLDIDDSVHKLKADWLHADAHRMLQTIINFLTNAMRYTADSKVRRVVIRVEVFESQPPIRAETTRIPIREEAYMTPPNYVWLSCGVVDTGRGLAPEELQKLFNRFVQADPTIDGISGFGLGLFVSKRIVELHDGYIEVESKRGRGSTFRFLIPAARAEKGSAQVESTAGLSFSRANRASRRSAGVHLQPHIRNALSDSNESRGETSTIAHILVVEDNIINQKVLQRQLLKAKYGVSVANNGQEAIDIVFGRVPDMPRIDLVLMDIEMPIKTGMEAIKEMRQAEDDGRLARRHATIAVTGNARQEQVENCRKAGFDLVCVKPYRINELCQQIEALRKDPIFL